MNSKYYYLVTSLPYLKFQGTSPISGEDFLSECEKWLTKVDLKTLSSADLNDYTLRPSDTRLLAEWKEFDINLGKALKRFRYARKTGETYKADEILKDIINLETPLLMERSLERVRWDYLDGREAENFFDINWLLIYFLKVQILKRLETFDKDKGEIFFYKLCEVSHECAIG